MALSNDWPLATLGHHLQGVVPMAIEGTKALKTVRNEAQAQELLNEGWLLLGLFDRQDGTDQYVEYHLGFPKEATKGQAGVFLPKRMRSDG